MKRVLLAEDNPVNQLVLTAFVKKLGYEVSMAEDGDEVLRKFELEGADLILMDCNMPGVDGLEATRRIRQMEKDRALPRTPIIAVTAHASGVSVKECHDAGMDAHVTKPIMFDELRVAMERWAT